MQTVEKSDGFRHETLNEMAVLRDEARVRLHLLSMEARQRWQVLEGTLENFEQDLRRRGESASEAVVRAAHKWTQMARDFLNSQVDSGR